MADIEDVFGKIPGRPNHRDFWRLSDVILKLDSGLDPSNPDEDAKEAQWRARMDEVGVDFDSISYMAVQRAYRVVGITSALDLMRPGVMREAAMIASVWMEAFAAGTFYEREHGL